MASPAQAINSQMNPILARRYAMMMALRRSQQPPPGNPPGGGRFMQANGGGWRPPPSSSGIVAGDQAGGWGQPPGGPPVPQDPLPYHPMDARIADEYSDQGGGGGDPTGGGGGGGTPTGGGGGGASTGGPSFQGWYDPNQNNSSQPNPFNKRDVFDQFQGLGQQNFQQQQEYQRRFGNLSNEYTNRQNQYGDLTNQLYSPIWQGGGGYDPEQMKNVLQRGGLDEVSGDLENNYLPEWRQAQIGGNPYSAFDLFRGQAPGLTALASNVNERAQGHVAAGRNRADSTLDQLRQDYGDATNSPGTQLSEDYMPGIRGTLARGRSDIGTAQSDPGLDLTSEYRRQAGMSDAEVNDTAERAAQDVGARYGADRDSVIQQALASGQGTPTQIAAALGGLNRSESADRSDALTRARLGARQAQRDAAQGVQSTALNAGQYRAGLRSSNALALQNSDIAANTTGEQMRLAAAQDLANRRFGAATNYGNAALNSNTALTGLAANTALQGGQAELGTGMYNANTATGLMGQGEEAAARRAQYLGENTQGTQRYNQNTRLGINNTLANRYTGAYAPWLANQQEGRQAAVGQQGYYGGQANTANQQGLQAWQIGNQGNQAAGSGYAGWGAGGGKGFGDFFGNALGSSLGKSIGTLGRAKGGVIDHNQLIEVGEGNRPEVILPLAPNTPPSRRNMWERMGANLGRSLGIPRGNAYRDNLARLSDEYSDDTETPGYADGGVAPSFWKKALAYGISATPARGLAPMVTGGKFDWRASMPAGIRGLIPESKPVTGPQMSTTPIQESTPEDWNAGGYEEDEDDGYPAYGRGGIPNLSLGGVKLNMPVMMPRISASIRPTKLPRSAHYARGGMVMYG